MLGAELLVTACVVALGLVALAVGVGVPRRMGRAHPTRRLLAVGAAMSITLAVPAVALAAASQPQVSPEENTTTVRYGPLLLPPDLGGQHQHQPHHGHDSDHGDEGGHGDHGGEGGHGGQGQGHHGQAMTYIAPTYDLPCRDCYITGLQPDLVYADGSPANYDTGAMLHHLVVFDPSQSDTTCGRDGVALLTGQRVFAAGNERTGAHLPAGYGYHLGHHPLGAMVELMNMSEQPQMVYITMEISWVEASDADLKEVTPLWLDVDNCGDSQYTVPEGHSNTTWSWESTMDGDILAVGGHVHDHGVDITLTNATRDEEICRSVAGYGTNPRYRGHIESMSTCIGDPLATISKGEELVIDSHYISPQQDSSAMGIMLAYIHQH